MTSEFEYFSEPQISKLFDLTLELAMDLHVTSTRLRALEVLLIRSGGIKDGELDKFIPTESEQVLLDKNRDEFMARLMRIITETGPSEHPLRQQWDQALEERGLSS